MEGVMSTESRSLTSTIAILGRPAHLGADAAPAAEKLGAVFIDGWNGEPLDVIAVPLLASTPEAAFQATPQLIKAIESAGPRAPRIVLVGKASKDSLLAVSPWLEKISVFAWVDSFSSKDFQDKCLLGLDEAREARQASASLAMYLEHNESLLKLSTELEARIEDRRNELNESTWRLQHSQRRSEIMHRALNAVHVSLSIPEMERQLLHILIPQNHAATDAPNVEWIRIAFVAQSRLDSAPIDTRTSSVFSCPLGSNGHIYFGRTPERPFKSEDKNFLTPIAEAVSLAVTRLRSLERMEQIKREWEETFNAIVNPIAVLDDQLRLVRGNRALLNGRAPEQVVGRPCYEAVFERSAPCSGCPVLQDVVQGRIRPKGRNFVNARTLQFRINVNDETTFEVNSRPLQQIERREKSLAESADSALLVHLYRNSTTTARFEKRIVESSKMAELGTIGSSIAHQLNNPIGGMLSHIQLLLMDLKDLEFSGKEDLHKELKEMESGTRRCAEIVRDLLGFTRRADEDVAHDHDLAEIVEQAIKITELQTRSRGIRFRLDLGLNVAGSSPEQTFLVRGRFNLLAQAVRAVLLALLPAGLRDQTIDVKIRNSDGVQVLIETPRGAWTQPTGGSVGTSEIQGLALDLTVAEQILTEHGGLLELSKNDQVQRAILSLPSPKL